MEMILPGPVDDLEQDPPFELQHLDPEHFGEEVEQRLFTIRLEELCEVLGHGDTDVLPAPRVERLPIRRVREGLALLRHS